MARRTDRARRRGRRVVRTGAPVAVLVLAALVLAVLVLAALVLAVPVLAAPVMAVPATAAAPAPAAASWEGDGELAVISDGRLRLFDNDGRSYVVAGPGAPSQPSWSPDGKWVAFLRTPARPPLEEPVSALWAARPDGSDAHRVSPPGADVTQFDWGPAAAGDGEALAFSTVSVPSYTSGAIYLATGSAPARRFATYSGLIDFSWAPSGQALAVSYRTSPEPDQPQAGKGFLEVSPLDGRAGRTVYTLADNGYVELAGWWPDGRGLLFWSDPAGSASIAADGLDLDSLELSTL
ncbi:MAG: hypothetical protein ABSE77_20915, partial [Acidimicrobiales bacterium]